MSGVWIFPKNGGVYHNPQGDGNSDGRQGGSSSTGRSTVLVYLPTGEVISSYSALEQILRGLGWERYYGGGPHLFQFHKHDSNYLISLPRDFSQFSSVHMYTIVATIPNVFHVRDI